MHDVSEGWWESQEMSLERDPCGAEAHVKGISAVLQSRQSVEQVQSSCRRKELGGFKGQQEYSCSCVEQLWGKAVEDEVVE